MAFSSVFRPFDGYRADDSKALHSYDAAVYAPLERQGQEISKIKHAF